MVQNGVYINSERKEDCDIPQQVDDDSSHSDLPSQHHFHIEPVDSSEDELCNNNSSKNESINNRDNLFSSYDRRRRLVKRLKVCVNKIGNIQQQGAILADVLNSPDMEPILKAGNIVSPEMARCNQSVVKQLWSNFTGHLLRVL